MMRHKKRLPVSRDALLHGTIVAAAVISLLLWGLPFLLGPAVLLALLGINIPADPFAWLFVRLFGALVVAGSYLYWHAYRDPAHHAAILRWAVLENALIAVTLLAVGFIQGIVANPLVWMSAVLAAAFCVSFAVLLPRDRLRVQRRPEPRPQARRRARPR